MGSVMGSRSAYASALIEQEGDLHDDLELGHLVVLHHALELLAHTDVMLRIVLDARSTVCRTASSKLSEDRPDSSMNFTTDLIPSLRC